MEKCIEKINLLLQITTNKQIHATLLDGKVMIEWPNSNKLTLSPNLAHILEYKKSDESKTEFNLKFNETYHNLFLMNMIYS